MKFFRILLIAFLLIFSTQFAFSQTRVDGKVVEVINGKTVVIETFSGKNRLVAELEYIEVPEPEQQLAQTVKEHLQKLLLGKDVEFVAKAMTSKKLVGKIFLNNVDMSRQLLRDGAAWYAVAEKNRQDAAESENYQLTEAQAKLEKRGVWGIQNLKPAWEFRAEKAKEKAREEAEQAEQFNANVQNSPRNVAQNRRKISAPKETMWEGIGGTQEKKYHGIEGLFTGYHSERKITYLYTGGTFLNLEKTGLPQKIEFRALYAYLGSTTIEKDIYIIGFLSESKNYKYEKANSLSISADKKPIYSDKAVRFYRPIPDGVQELLLYKIQRSGLEKILKAKNVTIKIGTTAASMKDTSQVLLERLLNVTN